MVPQRKVDDYEGTNTQKATSSMNKKCGVFPHKEPKMGIKQEINMLLHTLAKRRTINHESKALLEEKDALKAHRSQDMFVSVKEVRCADSQN